MRVSLIQRPASLVEDVCEKLALEIRRELDDGDGWLPPERQLAEQLGVSRTVVREATKRLELQGIIEVQHGVGIKVVDRLHKPLNGSLSLLLPDAAERLQQFVEVRLLLEPEVARRAAERATPAELKALRQVQTRLSQAKDVDDAIAWDLKFHQLLAHASGNRVFALLLESLADLGRESRKVTLSTTGIARAREHHEKILAAVERRDGAASASAMRFHVSGAADDLTQRANGRRNRKTK